MIFCGFFLFIVRQKDQRSCDVRGGGSGDIIFQSLGRQEIIVIAYSYSFGSENTLLQLRGGPNSDDWIEAWHSVYSLASVVDLKDM